MSEADAIQASQTAALLPVPRRRRRWLTVVLWLVIFFSGFVLGSGASSIVTRNQVLAAIHHPERQPARIAAGLRRSLRLDESQTKKVEAILRARQAALQAIRVDVQPRVVAELDLVEKQIDEVLEPAQKVAWHKGFNDLRRTWIPSLPEDEQ